MADSTSVSRRARSRLSSSSRRRRSRATGRSSAQAKVTFRDTRTGKTTTRFEKIRVTTRGGSGKGTAKVKLKSTVTKISAADKQRRIQAKAKLKVLAQKEQQKKILQSKITKQKESALRREQLLVKQKLGRSVTQLGEPLGAFGNTAEQRRRGAAVLNALTKRVRENQTKIIADRIQSISNKALRGETLTPSQTQSLVNEFNKKSNKLTVSQIKFARNLPKNVVLGIVDGGKALGGLVMAVNNWDPFGDLVQFGKRLKVEADKKNIPVLQVAKGKVNNFSSKTKNVARFVKNNPKEAALIVGLSASSIASEVKGSVTAAFANNPVRTTAAAITELAPGAVIKGAKVVGRIASNIVKAADKAIFSSNKVKVVSARILELERIKVKTRTDLDELAILRQQLRVDQRLKFITVGVDDLSKVPNKFIGPIKRAQQGLKGKAPKPTDNTVKKLVEAQKKLTAKQVAKKFRKSKGKGAKLTSTTQAKKLGEAFKTATAKKIAQKKLTAPEIRRITNLDSGIRSLTRELLEINKILKRGAGDRATTRLRVLKQEVLRDITRFESFSARNKNNILSSTSQSQKGSLIKGSDEALKELEKNKALRSLKFTLSKLERKLGIGKSGLLEQALSRGKLDFIELQSLTSKNFVRAVKLRNRILNAKTTLSISTIKGLNAQALKLINRGTLKPTIKVVEKIIRVGKKQVFKAKLRKIPAPLQKNFKKRDLKGQSLEKILRDDVLEIKRIRIQEVFLGRRPSTITKKGVANLLSKPKGKESIIRSIKQSEKDIGILKSSIRFLREQIKDKSLSKTTRVFALNEIGRATNAIRTVSNKKELLVKSLRSTKAPIDITQTARRQKLFAKKIADEVDKGKIRTIKVKTTVDPNDFSYRVNLPGGVQVEFTFNFPKPRKPLRGSKRASLGQFTKAKRPIAKVTFKKKSNVFVPKGFNARMKRSVVNNPRIRSGIDKVSVIKQQKSQLEQFRKQVKKKSTKNKIDTEIKQLNQLESRLNNAIKVAISVALANSLVSFVKAETRTTLKLSPVLKLDQLSKLQLRSIQKVQQLIQEINKDIAQFQITTPPKKGGGTGRAPPSKPRPPIKPGSPRFPKKPKAPKSTTKAPPIKSVKLLRFGSILPAGTRLKFDIVFRERRNPSRPFDRKNNPVVVKKRKLGLPFNKAIRKGFGGVDKTTQASAQLIISGITKIKDIKKQSSLLKKFTMSKTKNSLRFVERSRNRIDTRGEKRGLALSKVLKRKTRKKAKKTKK